MMSRDLVVRLDEASPTQMSTEELSHLLENAETLREENTSVCGTVRVLRLGELYLVQEQTPVRGLLLRSRPTLEAAVAFVEKRLQTYEKMWDG